jgi:hypothetical protein
VGLPLGEAAERMTLPVGLMREHPWLELVFSGGEGRLLTTGVTESERARVFYQQQGLDMARVRLEGGSARVVRVMGVWCDSLRSLTPLNLPHPLLSVPRAC